MANDDILAEEKEAFEDAQDAESDNRNLFVDDIRFGRLGEQWPEKIRKDRETEFRPCLTNNVMPTFIRQVVNDSRQNRPQIKVKPVDSNSDPATARAIGGIIRNIENQSNAAVAYDTGIDNAASGGFGYWRIAVEYDYDDSFNKCLRIKAVPNPLSVYGDPNSTCADSSDWNRAFVTDLMAKDAFAAQYKGADPIDWEGSGYDGLNAPWREDEQVLVCESWLREKMDRKILMLSSGDIVGAKEYETGRDYFDSIGVTPTQERVSKSFKVTQKIMTGAEILKTTEWAGMYIPIIPIYGEEVNLEGKRYFRSLIRDAKDAQRMANYWDTNATELVALAPRVPYIGEQGAFDADLNWKTANSKSHPYLQYKKGMQLPQRQPIDSGPAAGSITESMRATDKIKGIIGLYDASLGKKSNETSGIAINARKAEGDNSTFHFHDNQTRSIRHTGCILVDLIPKVYTGEQMMRILGEDNKETSIKIGQRPEGQPATPPEPTPEQIMQGENPNVHPNGYGDQTGQPIEHVFDLSIGKYDVVVDTGPSVTTQREQTAGEMMDLLKAFPQAAPFIGDLLVDNLDWKHKDEIAKRLKAMMPQQANGGMPPELQQMIQQGQQTIQEQGQQVQQLTQENSVLKAQQQIGTKAQQLDLKSKDLTIQELKMMIKLKQAADTAQPEQPQDQTAQHMKDAAALGIDAFNAQTTRMVGEAKVHQIMHPPPKPQPSKGAN